MLIAEVFTIAGIAAQGAGIYVAFGPAWAAIVVGTEVAALGVAGLIRVS